MNKYSRDKLRRFLRRMFRKIHEEYERAEAFRELAGITLRQRDDLTERTECYRKLTDQMASEIYRLRDENNAMRMQLAATAGIKNCE